MGEQKSIGREGKVRKKKLFGEKRTEKKIKIKDEGRR